MLLHRMLLLLLLRARLLLLLLLRTYTLLGMMLRMHVVLLVLWLLVRRRLLLHIRLLAMLLLLLLVAMLVRMLVAALRGTSPASDWPHILLHRHPRCLERRVPTRWCTTISVAVWRTLPSLHLTFLRCTSRHSRSASAQPPHARQTSSSRGRHARREGACLPLRRECGDWYGCQVRCACWHRSSSGDAGSVARGQLRELELGRCPHCSC